MGERRLDPERGGRLAVKLRELGVRGVLVTAAEQGYLTELWCQMPECLCPAELGGRAYFETMTAELSHWMPTHDHVHLQSEGGLRTVENTRLAHRLCNRVDYNKNHGIPYAKDLANAEEARLAVLRRGAPPPPQKLSDMFVPPGKTFRDKARFVRENLKEPDTKQALADLVRGTPKDLVKDIGDTIKVFLPGRGRKARRHEKREAGEAPASSTGTEDPEAVSNEPIRQLLDVDDFQRMVEQGILILNVDLPTGTEIIHRHPVACPSVTEHWFRQKVVENAGATGAYYAITDEQAARQQWPQLAVCKRCS
jgi:hypothetical protein